MNINRIISYIQFKKDIEITKKEIAEVVEKTEQTIYQYRKKDVPADWIEKIEKYYGCKLPLEDDTTENLAHNYFDLPYYEIIDESKHKIRKLSVLQVCQDAEILIRDLGVKPENARIIAMPSNKMEGGERPIKYNDILIVDTSLTDICYSGIYFFTTYGGKDVYVNIIDKTVDKVLFKFKNDTYKTKEYTLEQLKSADFKVVGRVVHNCSERL